MILNECYIILSFLFMPQYLAEELHLIVVDLHPVEIQRNHRYPKGVQRHLKLIWHRRPRGILYHHVWIEFCDFFVVGILTVSDDVHVF